MSPDLVKNRRPVAPQNPYRSENDDERRGIDHIPNFRAHTNLTHSPVRLRPPRCHKRSNAALRLSNVA